MTSNLLLASTLCASTLASRAAFSSLSTIEQADVIAQLAKWKAEYAPLAIEHGLVPQTILESIGLVDSHTDDELDRFYNTLQDVAEAQKSNPEAEFSPFNVFALLTQAEFDKIYKTTFVGKTPTAEAPATESTTAVAPSIDWTTNACNQPVRDQGQCGSCWAFSSVGTSEFAHCLATGQLLDLSEQQVVSCDTQSQGCDGGYASWAMNFERQGLCLESDYPYKSGDSQATGTCQTSCTKQALTLGKTVESSGEDTIVSVLNTQPVTVYVIADNSVWRNYQSGVVSSCPDAETDHAVIAVGYDDKSFKIKNSWGSSWGDNGYIYLQRGTGGKGTCRVGEFVAYPDLNTAPSSSNSTTLQPTTAPVVKPTKAPTTAKPTKTPKPTKTSKPTTTRAF
ncbi:hypothetical protein LEN26_006989 [Aphanomyces euteiches]|nr:hypothetical protein AeMF1_013397 [Aphanomyces euteiches]KAH9133808.1 hypothetical protein LEN26_006989 [Aphanomyces euteiches]